MNPIARPKNLTWILAFLVLGVVAATAALVVVWRPTSRPALTAEQAAALRIAIGDASRDVVARQPAIPSRDALRDVLATIAESAPTAGVLTLATLARRGRAALASLERATPVSRDDLATIAALLDRIDTLIAVPQTQLPHS